MRFDGLYSRAVAVPLGSHPRYQMPVRTTTRTLYHPSRPPAMQMMDEQKGPVLPWEVILHIIGFVPSAHLRPLLLTSKILRDFTEPLLYHDINLFNCCRRSILFLRTILRRTELARHVITFDPAQSFVYKEGTFTRTLRRLRRQSYDTRREATYRVYSDKVLEMLVNVESICVNATTSHFIHKLKAPNWIRQIRFLRLTGLADYGVLFDRLSLVTRLELPFTVFPVSTEGIRQDHLPLVEEVVCMADFAVKLVPGRPVWKLHLMFPLQLEWEPPISPYEIMTAISGSFAKITELALAVRGLWQGEMVHLLHAVGLFLPDVAVLYLPLSFYKDQTPILLSFLNMVRHNLAILDFHISKFPFFLATGPSASIQVTSSPRLQRLLRIRRPVLRPTPKWAIANVHQNPQAVERPLSDVIQSRLPERYCLDFQ